MQNRGRCLVVQLHMVEIMRVTDLFWDKLICSAMELPEGDVLWVTGKDEDLKRARIRRVGNTVILGAEEKQQPPR